MTVALDEVRSLVEGELAEVRDPRVVTHVRSLLVTPRIEQRPWDYGTPGQTYSCWIVLEDPTERTALAYCEEGFGPRCPWGLLWIGGTDEPLSSMGMDSSWYPRFMDAYFESFVATALPIWRVVRTSEMNGSEAVTGPLAWDAAWSECDARRLSEPSVRYDVRHNVEYGA